MCKPKKPKIAPLPPERAMARQPVRQQSMGGAAYAGGSRVTVRNPDGIIRRAPTAKLGGQGIALGSFGA